MLIYGELNVFRRAEAADLLARGHARLAPGGSLLLEPHTFPGRPRGRHGASHLVQLRRRPLSERPHLVLYEPFWHKDRPSPPSATTSWMPRPAT